MKDLAKAQEEMRGRWMGGGVTKSEHGRYLPTDPVCPYCRRASAVVDPRTGRLRPCARCFSIRRVIDREDIESLDREEIAREYGIDMGYAWLIKEILELPIGDAYCKECGGKLADLTINDWLCAACRTKNRLLGKKYGINLNLLHYIAGQQNYKCAICDSPIKLFVRHDSEMAMVDHCHELGHVRGLLCSRCNLGLGYFVEDPVAVENAARYVEYNHFHRSWWCSKDANGDELKPQSTLLRLQEELRERIDRLEEKSEQSKLRAEDANDLSAEVEELSAVSGKSFICPYCKLSETGISEKTGKLIPCDKCKTRRLHLYKYHLNLAQFSDMLEEQDYRCAICGVDFDYSNRNTVPVVDHSHSHGHNRGLLCAGCNKGIGCFQDRSDVLKYASVYLAANVVDRRWWRQLEDD